MNLGATQQKTVYDHRYAVAQRGAATCPLPWKKWITEYPQGKKCRCLYLML
jgi:hypothetical protein